MKRKYKITDGELFLFTGKIMSSMERDIVQFNKYGVTIDEINDLNNLKTECEEYPMDTYYLGDNLIAIETKNKTRKNLLNNVRNILKCVIIKWDIGSAQYNKFNTKKINVKRDLELLSISRKAAVTASEYLTELSSVGLTQSMIDTVSSTADEFEQNLHEIDNAIENRKLKAEEKITKFNELYSIVAKYCQIGKLIWQDSDEAKYNDYLIRKAKRKSTKKKIIIENIE